MKDFDKWPGLKHSYKYREELSNILCGQRLMWYAYNMHDHKVTTTMRELSGQLRRLMKNVDDEKFREVIKGLEKIVTRIDDTKNELAQLMVDPQSRTGGTSLFADILNRTSSSFGLPELHKNLNYKIERLDMLGIHVGEVVHEASQIRVAEGTRSTQLTLELLEAFIIGFYAAEVSHWMPFKEIALWNTWWISPLIGTGAFLTVLPWLTLVRKSLSHFPPSEPTWLKAFEKAGVFVGPGILLVVFGFVIDGLSKAKIQENSGPPITTFAILLLVITYVTITGSWLIIKKWDKVSVFCCRKLADRWPKMARLVKCSSGT